MISDSTETSQLLERVAAGDRRAIAALLARNHDRLHRLIALRLDPKIRRRVDPSDVVQETHVAALRELDDFLGRRPMPFHLWLEKTALERLAKLRRRHRMARRRSVEREVLLPDHTSRILVRAFCGSSRGPAQEAARKDLRQKVLQALMQLPETDREILIMRYIEHRSHAEIGSILGMRSDAVSRRHGRAILKLAKLVRGSGIVESDV